MKMLYHCRIAALNTFCPWSQISLPPPPPAAAAALRLPTADARHHACPITSQAGVYMMHSHPCWHTPGNTCLHPSASSPPFRDAQGTSSTDGSRRAPLRSMLRYSSSTGEDISQPMPTATASPAALPTVNNRILQLHAQQFQLLQQQMLEEHMRVHVRADTGAEVGTALATPCARLPGITLIAEQRRRGFVVLLLPVHAWYRTTRPCLCRDTPTCLTCHCLSATLKASRSGGRRCSRRCSSGCSSCTNTSGPRRRPAGTLQSSRPGCGHRMWLDLTGRLFESPHL